LGRTRQPCLSFIFKLTLTPTLPPIQKTMSKKTYSFEDYNEYNVLKIPFNLILTTLYLMKYFFILIFLPIAAKLPKMDHTFKAILPYVEQFAHHHANLLLLLPSVPAVMIMVGMFRRIPKTGTPWIRNSWAKGRMLLSASVIAELLLLVLFLLLGIKELNGLLIVILYLNAMVLLYLLRSQRVRDVFAEFPEYKAEEKD